MAYEIKAVACDLKSVETDGSLSGYASRFGVVDLGRDLVLPGAFRESLRQRGPQGIKMLFQHDPAEPIGIWLEVREDALGLFARGPVLPEVAPGREVRARVPSSLETRSASIALGGKFAMYDAANARMGLDGNRDPLAKSKNWRRESGLSGL